MPSMPLRTFAVASTSAGLAAALGYAIAFWIEHGITDWLLPALCVLSALLLVAWFVLKTDLSGTVSVLMFFAIVLVAAVVWLVVVFAFLSVECQTFDNCIHN
jgi:hypothetical protein